MPWYQPALQDPISLLPILGMIFVIGLVWTAIRKILKLTMRLFAIGCIGILLLGAALVLFASFGSGL